MFYAVTYSLSLIIALIHIWLDKKPKTVNRISEIFLMYFLFFGVGISGVYGFIGHAFLADQVANYIGWPAGNPFQFEVAVANLGYGVAGLLALKFRNNFWFALITYYSIFGLGAAYGHIHQIMLYDNMASGNAGVPLYLDIAKPIFLITLFIIYRLSDKKKTIAD